MKVVWDAHCIVFKSKWAPLTHHILTTRESFNWAQILLVVLKEDIEKYQKTPTSKNPTFYLSAYVMDVFYAGLPFLAVAWNWASVGPPVHIYCSVLWEDNFIPLIYDICDHFICHVYKKN